SSRRRHTRLVSDWSSDVCSSDLVKGAQAPDGSRIAFELTGPAARRLRLAVDSRAELVDEFDSPATVEITMPSGLFARLRGGRTKIGRASCRERGESSGVGGS